METEENKTAAQSPGIKGNAADLTENYHQVQVDGEDQTVLVDPRITAETDDLDPAFHQQNPPVDPEDEQDEDEDDDDRFPAKEDLEEDDYDLNHDQDDDLSLNIDNEELN